MLDPPVHQVGPLLQAEQRQVRSLPDSSFFFRRPRISVPFHLRKLAGLGGSDLVHVLHPQLLRGVLRLDSFPVVQEHHRAGVHALAVALQREGTPGIGRSDQSIPSRVPPRAFRPTHEGVHQLLEGARLHYLRVGIGSGQGLPPPMPRDPRRPRCGAP